MNVSASLNIFKLVYKPSLCLPHATVSTFNDLPVPLCKAFAGFNHGHDPDIRAVVLDKDDCFARPLENVIYKPYYIHFRALSRVYPGSRLLIVSNSTGTSDDVDGKEAEILQRATGVEVLKHSTKKPGCGAQILDYFLERPETGVNRANQIAVVGDRLSTDIMMANMYGFWGLWIKDGIIPNKSLLARCERHLPAFLAHYGLIPPQP